jgi:uncharacterized membrane protein YfcA
MPHDPVSLSLIFASLMLVGLAKGGLAGIGMLGMPLMAMVFPPVEAGAILLPLLIVQDAFGVWLYHKHWNRAIVGWMMPGALAGIVAAAVFAASVSEQAILALLGVISILFGLWRLWVLWHKIASPPLTRSEWPGLIFGFFSGFTSQIAHAGAPPFQIWVIPKKLPHMEFVGTSAIFFALMNWIKVPAFVALGAFSREALTLAALFLPIAIVGMLAGAWLVKRVNGPVFYGFVNAMLVVVGLKLIGDALG